MIRQRLFLLFLFFFFLATGVFSQTDTSHLRISLLTCGVGDEVWETYGHTGIRIVDSIKGTDNVYNYGTFNGYEEGFELKFIKGKLWYYLSYYPFYAFVQEYAQANRSISEQVLMLDGLEKERFYEFLQWNAQDENKYYRYDFLYDNCATRVRDAFPKTFGNYFSFGPALPENGKTFRRIINHYLYRKHLERFGINILLGSRIDQKMTNKEIMFLPDFLQNGIGKATIKGKKIAGESTTILDGSPHLPAGINWAFVLTLSFALLTIAGVVFPSLKQLGKFMNAFLLFLSGLIGVFILFMWFGTDHGACKENYNLLWALPTNLLVPFFTRKGKTKYALIAMVLILLVFLLHILGIQEFPLFELAPLLLAMLIVFGMIYKNDKKKIS